MDFQVNCINNSEYEFKLLESKNIVGSAFVKKMQDRKGEFWHLDDLEVQKPNRQKGHGGSLVKYLINYLWKIDKLRIRVHPAIGEQATEQSCEEIQNLSQEYSEDELDEIDRKLVEEMKKPDFWTNQKFSQKLFNSEELKAWYRKQGFTNEDGQYLWCYPE
jgi:hypothetical protein